MYSLIHWGFILISLWKFSKKIMFHNLETIVTIYSVISTCWLCPQTLLIAGVFFSNIFFRVDDNICTILYVIIDIYTMNLWILKTWNNDWLYTNFLRFPPYKWSILYRPLYTLLPLHNPPSSTHRPPSKHPSLTNFVDYKSDWVHLSYIKLITKAMLLECSEFKYYLQTDDYKTMTIMVLRWNITSQLTHTFLAAAYFIF